MTDNELMEIARPFAADGGRWPSEWITVMRLAISASQRGDTSEAAQRTAIAIEKKLCATLDRNWSPVGMSVESLVYELIAMMRSN